MNSSPRRARTDDDTEQLVRDLRDQVRELNYATMNPPGLTQPGTTYTILGNLAAAEQMLVQTLWQVDRFLAHELEQDRLGHDGGHAPDESIGEARFQLAHAGTLARELSEVLAAAQTAVAFVHGSSPALETRSHETMPAEMIGEFPEPSGQPISRPPAQGPGDFDDPARPREPGSRPRPTRRS